MDVTREETTNTEGQEKRQPTEVSLTLMYNKLHLTETHAACYPKQITADLFTFQAAGTVCSWSTYLYHASVL